MNISLPGLLLPETFLPPSSASAVTNIYSSVFIYQVPSSGKPCTLGWVPTPAPVPPMPIVVTASSTGLSAWQQWPTHSTNGSNSSLWSKAPVDSPWTWDMGIWGAWKCAVQTESPTQTCGHDVTIQARGDLPQALGEITSTVTSQ